MPPYERTTTGLWIDVSKDALELMKMLGLSLAAAIHSAQHAVLNRFALSADLRTECKADEKERMKTPTTRTRPARLVFYEHASTGGSIAARAFDHSMFRVHSSPRRLKPDALLQLVTSCNRQKSASGRVIATMVAQNVRGVRLLFGV